MAAKTKQGWYCELERSTRRTKRHERAGRQDSQVVGTKESFKSIVDLPDVIIRRILYFVHCGGTDKVWQRFQDILNFLFTCRHLYHEYYYVLFALEAVTVRDDSSRTDKFFAGKTTAFGFKCLQCFAHKLPVRESMRMLNIKTTAMTPFDRLLGVRLGGFASEPQSGPQPKDGDTFCSFLISPFDNLLLSTLPQFHGLHTVGLEGRSIKTFLYVCRLPRNVKTLSLFIDFHENNFNNYRDLSAMLKYISDTAISADIENLQIFANYPIMQTKIHSTLCLANTKPLISLYEEYFSMKVVTKFEKVNCIHKRGLVIFGTIIYHLLDKFRYSLKSIEVEKLDCALVFNNSLHQDSDLKPLLYNYHFPRLRLFVLDNISSVKLDTWIKDLQAKNLSLRNKRSLFIAMHDQLSGSLLTRTAIQETRTSYSNTGWSHLKNPVQAIQEIKSELKVYL